MLMNWPEPKIDSDNLLIFLYLFSSFFFSPFLRLIAFSFSCECNGDGTLKSWNSNFCRNNELNRSRHKEKKLTRQVRDESTVPCLYT